MSKKVVVLKKYFVFSGRKEQALWDIKGKKEYYILNVSLDVLA